MRPAAPGRFSTITCWPSASPNAGATVRAVMSSNNALYPNMTYDAAKDFQPVVFIASITNVLIVPPDSPAHSVKQLIALAEREPGQLSFASSGAGSSTHMSAELFKSLARVDLLHVPYKGSGQ